MNKLYLSLSLALALLGLSGLTSLSTAHGAEPETLVSALSLIDQVPTRAQLLALGADAEGAALRRIAEDASRPAYTRIRAVSFLAWFDSAETRSMLTRLLTDEAAPIMEMRVQALRALARLEGPAARPRLERYLGHGAPELRGAAERALLTTNAVSP